MAKIGKNILENLTTGMYSDSKVAYREYIQNACDQIDKAISMGIVEADEAEISISIDQKKRNITIIDNATGVPQAQFEAQLGDIANSDKKLGSDKGFRGIGRLCGLAYCHYLHFVTSYPGEPAQSCMKFDARRMREMISSTTKYTVDEILERIVTVETKPSDSDSHFFKVELVGINPENTDLLDSKKVREYLSFVAPVPYTNKFDPLSDAIYKHAQLLDYHIDEYRIRVNGAEIFKEYRKKLYSSDSSQKFFDEFTSIECHDFRDENGKLLAWMWYGICRFEKAIPKSQNPMYGLRLRQGNIQIGDNTALAHLFKEDRGNSYYIGEVFAVDSRLIPNSQRNYFNENPTRSTFENLLREYFYNHLHKLYHAANELKNAYKRLQEYDNAVNKLEEKQRIGFVDDAEKQKLTAAVSEAAEKKKDAQKKLDRIEKTTASEGSEDLKEVLRRIRERAERKGVTAGVKKSEKIEKKLIDDDQKNNAYFTDRLSKLDKKKRHLVRQIMSIVSRIAPEDIYNQIRSEIEREFK